MSILDDEEIRLLRRSYLEGVTPSSICRHLLQSGKARDVNGLLEILIEAFGVTQADVSCIGGWWMDGSGELSDSAIDRFIAPAIERRRLTWNVST